MSFEEEFFEKIQNHCKDMLKTFKKYPEEAKRYQAFYREQFKASKCGFKHWDRWFAFPYTEDLEEYIFYHNLDACRKQILLSIPKYFTVKSDVKIELNSWESQYINVEFLVDGKVDYDAWNNLDNELKEKFDYFLDMLHFMIFPRESNEWIG